MKSLTFRIIAKLLIIVALLVAVISLGAYGFRHSSGSNDGKLHIVAGENVWGDIISQIGGNKVTVTSIINDPNADPHLYESDAHDALAVAQAKLVVANGLGYDDFLGKLLSASPNKQRSELTVATVLHVAGNNANPHLWYDLPRIHTVATAFEQALGQKDPADTAIFAANLKTFDASLQPLLDKIKQINTQFKGAPVAYTERVPGYLLTDAGLSNQTPAGFASSIEDGSDPTPADQTAMANLLTSKHVDVLLYNAQATSPITVHVRAFAQKAGIPVVGLTETIPAQYKTYQSWQSAQLDALLVALNNSIHE